MIPLSDQAMAVLTRSHRRSLRVESWLDGELLADDIPVADGAEETDLGLRVPERLTLSVPRRDRGVDWSPTTATHPLAANGQRLRLKIGVGIIGGVEWFQRGEYLVTVDVDDDDRQGSSPW